MVAGSLIAGSTPLGGGIVAFPVSELTIGFKPAEGRDFSALVQSVGMTAASFLIVTAKRHLCHWWLITWSIVAGGFGIIIGLETELSPFLVNALFTTYIAVFALGFFYKIYVLKAPASISGTDGLTSPWDSGSRNAALAATVFVVVFGMLGGFMTAQTGSGADVMSYVFGTFIWNSLLPPEHHLSENTLTASSA